jgi:hypothetical protein
MPGNTGKADNKLKEMMMMMEHGMHKGFMS